MTGGASPRPADPDPDPGSGAARRLADIRRRAYLTYKYDGLWGSLYRVLALPLRFTPLRRHARLRPRGVSDRAAALRWYAHNARPVCIVIPDGADVDRLVAGLRATTREKLARLVVVGGSAAPRGVEVVAGGGHGFAADVNRGLRAAGTERDVVILDAAVELTDGWLACLQYAAHRAPDVGIVGPMMIGPDGRVRAAGSARRPNAPGFDQRFVGRPAGWGPANIVAPVLAVSGACMYVRREVVDQVGALDEDVAHAEVDYCLRAWQAGWRAIYAPAARLRRDDSGADARDADGERRFWAKWGDFFDARSVRAPDGGLRVIYVTEDTGVGGGHRDIFEHVNGLLARGHHPEVWSLSGQPAWFHLHVAVRRFADFAALTAALRTERALKVATWWNTAAPVWLASVLEGIPVSFVQDIETSYYPTAPAMRDAVLASYREEFRYMTISSWNRERLGELGLDARLIPPGIDLENFRPLPDVARRDDMVLALGRSEPLKNLPLTLAAWGGLPDPRPELCLFGIEPALAVGPGIRYVEAPTDAEVNELFNAATVFVQTSSHEGFSLPPLESMATGGSVVCTDADGNRDFCADGVNCLMPKPTAEAVTAALARVLGDPSLRDRLGAAGMATAAEYAWARRLDALEAFLDEVARSRRVDPAARR